MDLPNLNKCSSTFAFQFLFACLCITEVTTAEHCCGKLYNFRDKEIPKAHFASQWFEIGLSCSKVACFDMLVPNYLQFQPYFTYNLRLTGYQLLTQYHSGSHTFAGNGPLGSINSSTVSPALPYKMLSSRIAVFTSH
jgi:hypothetical protein